MILKLGVKHQGEELYKIHINHDPWMTLTQFMASSTLVAHEFEWGKLSKCHLKRKKNRRKWANGLKIYDSEKKLDPGLGCPQTGQYM